MNQWLQLSRCRKSRTCCIWISTVNIIYCIYVMHMPYIRSSAWPCNWLDHVLSMPQEWRWGTQCISRYHLKPSTKAKQSLSCLSKKNVRQSSVRVWCTRIPPFFRLYKLKVQWAYDQAQSFPWFYVCKLNSKMHNAENVFYVPDMLPHNHLQFTHKEHWFTINV